MRCLSLKYTLGLLLVFAVTGTSLAIYLVQGNVLEKTFLLRAEDKAAKNYQLSANIFAEETTEMMNLAFFLAGNPPLINELNSILSHPASDRTISKTEILPQILGPLVNDLKEERHLTVVSKQGFPLFRSEFELPSLSLNSWGMYEVLAGEPMLVTTKHNDNWEVRAMVPIQSDQKVIGALVITTRLDNLLAQVGEIVGRSMSLHHYAGVEADMGDGGSFLNQPYDQSRINMVMQKKQPLAVQSDDGLLLYYYQILRVADEDFCLVIKKDLGHVRQLLAAQRQDSMRVTLLILTVTLLISLLACRWLLHPLVQLREKLVTSGELLTGINIVPSQGDEISSLVLTFDTMLDALQMYEAQARQESAQLEKRVHDRTQQLNMQNEQLCREIDERMATEVKLREKEEHLNHLAHHDPLTGLPNRTLLSDRLVHGIKKAIRYKQQAGLLFLDLDRFKTINDTIGHAAGDHILSEIAIRLKTLVRQSDTLARVGGDEFVVFIENVEDSSDISRLAQKIIESISAPLYFAGKPFYLSMSIGISLYPTDGTDADTLMKFADVAMYRAKEKGGKNYQIYTPEMNARAHELLELERGLHTCLEEDQLILHYQPQIDLNTEELVGMEALLRWQTPDRGLILPNDFIPLAEQTGLIVAMGEWALKTACLQYMEWQEQGLPSFKMAVNISPRQFRSGSLVATVTRVLRKTGMQPQNLELEITESMVMDDVEAAINTMQEFADMGITLAIDDFGSGYSSLAYLKKFPIAKLKIDRAFVRDIPKDENDKAITIAAIALAKSMNLETIAEGVETEAQLDFLRSQGCSQGQGYFFGRPVEAGELTAKWGKVS